MSTFSAFTSDLKKRPELLEGMNLEAYACGEFVTVTTRGPLTIVTSTI